MTCDTDYVMLAMFVKKTLGEDILKVYKICILTFFMLFITACVAPPKTESMGEYIDSSAITTKVKARFVDTMGSTAFQIQVKTFKDVVQLSGFVNSESVKRRASVIAANTSGVRQVRNDLIVK